jgi:hypothetical protein
METEQEIATQSGVTLTVKKQILDDAIEISLALSSDKECLLHWGLSRHPNGSWETPPRSAWPPGSRAFDHAAVRTSFAEQKTPGLIVIHLDKQSRYSYIGFALYYPAENRWDNRLGQDYRIEIPSPLTSESFAAVMQMLDREMEGTAVCHTHIYRIDEDSRLGVVVRKTADARYHIVLLCEMRGPLVLHWGISDRNNY